MTCYAHKVYQIHDDGWGRSQPRCVVTLGTYDSLEKAQAAKDHRDAIATVDRCSVRANDSGASWIDAFEVQ